MNGIGLLVLISLFGQLGQSAPTGSNGPVTALNQTTVQDNAKDFGWQISPEDGALEYIVQISPEEALTLQSNHWENPSDLPPQLVGRATRILVRIGNEVLPREPSLAEIDATMKRYSSARDLSAALDPGRMSTIESEAMRSVQNGNPAGAGLPSLPFPNSSSGQNTSLTDSLADLGSQALERARGTGSNPPNPADLAQLSNDFLGGARNHPSGGVNSATGQRDVTNSLPSTTPQGNTKFNNTAPAVSGNPGATGAAPTGSVRDPSFENDRRGTTGWQNTDERGLPEFPSGANATNSDPRSLDYNFSPGIAQRGQMPGRSLSDNIGQGQSGYGRDAPPGYNGNGYANTYDGNPNAGNGYGIPEGQDPYRQGSGIGNPSGNPALLANRTALPAATNSPPNATAQSSSPSDTSSTGAASSPKTNENFLNVFFVLSLVVNFYLAMLIRKLLTRYRSLLSSVRSQTA